MFQTRIHGRGGQGVVTAAEMLSVAAFREGRFAQAFPSFGSERTGAPVVAFCRIDDKTIRLREPIMQPDALIIQDPTLLQQVDVFGGLVPDGYILINTSRNFSELGLEEFVQGFHAEHLCTVPASEFAAACPVLRSGPCPGAHPDRCPDCTPGERSRMAAMQARPYWQRRVKRARH